MTNFSPTVTRRDPDPHWWEPDFKWWGSAGLSCKLCHAMVVQSPGETKGHMDWHRDQGHLDGPAS